ncbi:MAG: hypothetical protein WCH39_09635, partial [Schlesneria sp.]
QQNQYDARTFRTVILSYTAGVLSETRHSYFSSDWRCVEERVETASTAERQFVWGVRYIDDLVCRNRTSETLYALQDANWSVASIAGTTGEVQERYAYSAYGLPLFLNSSFGSSSSTFAWETLFLASHFETQSGMSLMRKRFLHSQLGSWITQDPLGSLASISLYTFLDSAPNASVDPYGTDACRVTIYAGHNYNIHQMSFSDYGAVSAESFDEVLAMPSTDFIVPVGCGSGVDVDDDGKVDSIQDLLNIKYPSHTFTLPRSEKLDDPEEGLKYSKTGPVLASILNGVKSQISGRLCQGKLPNDKADSSAPKCESVQLTIKCDASIRRILEKGLVGLPEEGPVRDLFAGNEKARTQWIRKYGKLCDYSEKITCRKHGPKLKPPKQDVRDRLDRINNR